jgi:hypothetical protein
MTTTDRPKTTTTGPPPSRTRRVVDAVDERLGSPGQQFTVDVSAEEVPETGEFVRRIVTGPFSPTTKIDYCDPDAGGHED